MPSAASASIASQTAVVLAWLKRQGSQKNIDGMARYGIVAPKVFGISVGTLRQQARKIGRNHELAEALWKTGWYEARMLATMIDDPGSVTPAQMDRWCRDFDNWGICDTACFCLFDRTQHAHKKVVEWARHREEFIKRAAFALAASLAGHDKTSPDAAFMKFLPLIERAAPDGRNFVKKGVSWALRGIGSRSPDLHAAALTVARRLAASPEAAARWVGKDAVRDLTRPLVLKRVTKKAKKRSGLWTVGP
jgi:3-methyladenine DNA glycosylase AlkD